MIELALADRIVERREAIQSVVSRIEQGSSEVDLQDLQALLVDVAGRGKRDPGIEMAADDLFAAAAAVVTDRNSNSQPIARKLRLLRDAGFRLQHRLASAAERCAMRTQVTGSLQPCIPSRASAYRRWLK
ncbi:hypothetical protein AA309_05575 [Microvirga vignae]|uniref:Uncharacterized protein n=1 Tax=Microvirga vignae TaxID=1225564 RepID=A0A0H1RMS2_9HYPH|nr:hypothetical protein AA309_05575 [Microvirga vignae]